MAWLWGKVAADPFNVLSAVLAAVFLACYFLRCHQKNVPIDLADLGAGVLSCGGVVSGVLIILSAFFPHLSAKLPDNVLFTIMIGAMVLVISVRVVMGAFRK